MARGGALKAEYRLELRPQRWDLTIPHPARIDGIATVTVSVGYAGTGENRLRDARDLVIRADLALYEAKSAGRNRSKAG
ncbi:diguanylate cyclase [Rhizobium sp. AG855]|uniref:diguanylate cyclase domain-containing protein n=1 Tax=Rhizobium sp. AG855 TaxID=2183898 RepID=UPI000E7605C4|nr:diguanylate cyclase [Rhizobium sp. AG855]